MHFLVSWPSKKVLSYNGLNGCQKYLFDIKWLKINMIRQQRIKICTMQEYSDNTVLESFKLQFRAKLKISLSNLFLWENHSVIWCLLQADARTHERAWNDFLHNNADHPSLWDGDKGCFVLSAAIAGGGGYLSGEDNTSTCSLLLFSSSPEGQRAIHILASTCAFCHNKRVGHPLASLY